MTARVAGLYVHPLKSAAAVPLDIMHFDAIGAANDRRWMMIDERGVALTQREAPALALVGAIAARQPDVLVLRRATMQSLEASASDDAKRVQVDIWGDTVAALDAGDEAAEWCTAAVGVNCRLVRIDPDASRPLAPKYAGALESAGRHVAFTDGSPALLLSTASIESLNQRLADEGKPAVGVERFRPNILLDGIEPHEEDSWLDISIGTMRFGVGSTCPRCVMTTVDQSLGQRAGAEPLQMLSTYRRMNGKAMFGVNATHAGAGAIHLGDLVHIHSVK